jgi:ABC-2 type transport system permease protein
MIKTLIFHLKIGLYQQAQSLKAMMAYQEDFWIGLTANILLHVVNLLFITVIFEKIPNLHGWGKHEMYFIYGLAIIPNNIFHGLFSNIYNLSNHIVEGNLDRVLLRPVNGLFQIYIERVALEDLGDIFIGIAVLIYASLHLQIQFQWWDIPMMLLLVLCSVGVLLGVFTTLSCLGFWFLDRAGLIPPIYNMMQFSRYPVTIYPTPLRVILSWIIPFAFIGFYPSTWLLRRSEFLSYIWMTPVVAIVCMSIGSLTWHLGLKRYESTGS